MTHKLSLRTLLLGLFATFFVSFATADIYVTATQNSGASVEKTASAPSWADEVVFDDTGEAYDMWLSGSGSGRTVHVVIDTFNPTGTYWAGEVWDSAWVDWETVYATIN